MDAPQLSLFDANVASPSRVVVTVNTDLGIFGNRTDLIVVDGETVGGTSLIECDDHDVQFFNHQLRSRLSDSL